MQGTESMEQIIGSQCGRGRPHDSRRGRRRYKIVTRHRTQPLFRDASFDQPFSSPVSSILALLCVVLQPTLPPGGVAQMVRAWDS